MSPIHTLVRAARWAGGAALGLGLVFALATGGPGVARAQASGDGPALWVVRDADSTLYLFGTVHVLRPSTVWRWVKVDDAFDSADEVWLEISNPDDQAALVPLIQEYGMSPDRPLSVLLDADEEADLDAAARTIGATGAALEPMRPWMAGLTLSMAPLARAGYDPASGVELTLKARAEAAGKPVHGFETIDQQVRILAGMPEPAQLAFLRATLEDFDQAAEQLDGMVEAWANGDVRTIDRLAVREMKAQSAQLYEDLLVDRNQAWAARIEAMLEGSGTVFIAVGAAHLAGGDSVQEILKDRGVRAERL